MAKIRFEDLLLVYRNAAFATGNGEDEAVVTVTDPKIVALLTRVETEEYAVIETGVTLLDDLAKVQLGAAVKVRLETPRTGFGVLARTIDGLIKSLGGRRREPKNYFLVDSRYEAGAPDPPELVQRYRKMLEIIDLLAHAATLVDDTRSALIFVKDGQFEVPYLFDAADLGGLDVTEADRLLAQFADELHQDQKHAILFETVVELCRGQPRDARFKFILRSLKDAADKVAGGYKLFASNFSYSKIKGELEDARIDYTQKIHKTIVDIQNQLLGIPVATVVVASQMKAPTTCGPEAWVNFAVLIGAWIFVALLLMAIVNQWLTLDVIGDEIQGQKKRLQDDFKAISNDFRGTFERLGRRICWHHCGLVFVAVVGIVGLGIATRFYNEISALPPQPCPAQAKGVPSAAAGVIAAAAPSSAPSSPANSPAGGTASSAAALPAGPAARNSGAAKPVAPPPP